MIIPFAFSREHIITKAYSQGSSVGCWLAVCIAVPMTMCPCTCALTVAWGRGADRNMGITGVFHRDLFPTWVKLWHLPDFMCCESYMGQYTRCLKVGRHSTNLLLNSTAVIFSNTVFNP